MRRDPSPAYSVIVKLAVLRRTMAHLADKPQFQAGPAVARDRKADGVGDALLGQSGATGGVSQIAELL
jgi:hypothetical protein